MILILFLHADTSSDLIQVLTKFWPILRINQDIFDLVLLFKQLDFYHHLNKSKHFKHNNNEIRCHCRFISHRFRRQD